MENFMQDLFLEGHKIKYRNFSGRQTEFNRLGDKNFTVVLDPSEVEQIMALGWPVKVKGTPEEPSYEISVHVRFDHNPPRVALVTESIGPDGNPTQKITELNEESVGVIDSAEIIDCDILLHPWVRTSKVNPGVSVFLKGLFVKVVPNPLAEKYGY